MKLRLVIHIGMHKTGSTSIQRFLSRNRWYLNRRGVFYPPSFGENGARQPKHGALFSAISHEADFGAPHPVLGAASEKVQALADQIETRNAAVSILSAEGLSGERPVFAQALAPLAKRFDCRVVMFLRRPDDWVESFYKQMVMSDEVREARAFDAFLAAEETRAHLDFATIINWWSEAFGAQSIQLCAYSNSRGAPVRAFLKAAGIAPRFALLPYGRTRANVSPDVDVIEARRRENAGDACAFDANRLYGESKSYFSRQARDEVWRDADVIRHRIEMAHPSAHDVLQLVFPRVR